MSKIDFNNLKQIDKQIKELDDLNGGELNFKIKLLNMIEPNAYRKLSERVHFNTFIRKDWLFFTVTEYFYDYDLALKTVTRALDDKMLKVFD